MVTEIAAKFFLSISTAEAIVNAINNGMGFYKRHPGKRI